MREFTPVRESVEAWTAAWSARDPRALMSLWDVDSADASYLPAEKATPLRDSAEIEAYIQTTCGLFSEVRHRAENVITRQLTEDSGLAFYSLAWMFTDHHGPIGGSCRVTSVWCKRGEGWLCNHYAEAPLAPLLELQHFYESVADDGLDAIPVRS